jgi:hypothetical protein
MAATKSSLSSDPVFNPVFQYVMNNQLRREQQVGGNDIGRRL